MVLEMPGMEDVPGVIVAFLVGMGVLYGFYRAYNTITDRPAAAAAAKADVVEVEAVQDVTQSERLEYYEGELVQMRMRLDAMELEEQMQERVEKEQGGRVAEQTVMQEVQKTVEATPEAGEEAGDERGAEQIKELRVMLERQGAEQIKELRRMLEGLMVGGQQQAQPQQRQPPLPQQRMKEDDSNKQEPAARPGPEPKEQVPAPDVASLQRLDPPDYVLHLITNKAMTSRDIQVTLRRSREHTSRFMKKLFDDGYVRRSTGSRPYTYSITERGRERMERVKAGSLD